MRYKNFTIKLYDLPFLESIKPLGISAFARALSLFTPATFSADACSDENSTDLAWVQCTCCTHASSEWWSWHLASRPAPSIIVRLTQLITIHSDWETHALDAAAAQVASYIILYSCCHLAHVTHVTHFFYTHFMAYANQRWHLYCCTYVIKLQKSALCVYVQNWWLFAEIYGPVLLTFMSLIYRSFYCTFYIKMHAPGLCFLLSKENFPQIGSAFYYLYKLPSHQNIICHT